MAVIPGNTYAERAIAGTLTGRHDSSFDLGEESTTKAELEAAIASVSGGWRRIDSQSYYPAVTGPTGTAAQALGTVQFTPIIVPETRTLTEIWIEVTTLAAGSEYKLGLYENRFVSGNARPGTVLEADLTAISAATTGYKNISLSRSLTKGIYWLAIRSTTSNAGSAAALRTRTTPPYDSLEVLGGGFAANTFLAQTGQSTNPAGSFNSNPAPYFEATVAQSLVVAKFAAAA